MVYCGPPSRGCDTCRTRKVRCDLREPGCGQCEKQQRSCPGYRNMVDLMFRDESSSVIKKAQAKKQRRRQTIDSPSAPTPSTDSDALLSYTSSPYSATGSPSSRADGPEMQSSQNSQNAQSAPRTAWPARLTLLTKNDTVGFPPPRSRSSSRGPGRGAARKRGRSRIQKGPSPSRSKADMAMAGPSSSAAGPSLAKTAAAHLYSLPPTLQERGTAYFFSRYVTMDENALHHRFDFIYDVWRPTVFASQGQPDVILASMTAVGLAGLAELTQSSDYLSSAHKSYGTALHLVHEAIRDPQEAVRDTTILCVLILGIFEMMVSSSTKTTQAWYKHIRGAVTLAHLRGTSQLRTSTGIRMFNVLCHSVTIACLQKHMPMPPELMAFQSELLSADGAAALSWGCSRADLARPTYMMLQMRHDVHAGTLSDLDETLKRLLGIDAEFQRAAQSFPASSGFRVLRVLRSHQALFHDYCHVYRNTSIACLWNILRVNHFLVLEFLLTTIQRHFPDAGDNGSHVPSHYLAVYRQTCAKLQAVTDGMVASVPQHLNLLHPVTRYFAPSASGETIIVAIPSTTLLSKARTKAPATLAASPLPVMGLSPSPSILSSSSSSSSSPSSAGSPTMAASVNSLPHPLDYLQTGNSAHGQRLERGLGLGTGHEVDSEGVFYDDGGPTLENPTRCRTPAEGEDRLMLLASAPNGVIWPLFCVGTSSLCTPELRKYVLDHLVIFHEEIGIRQAGPLVTFIRNRQLIPSIWHALGKPAPSSSSSSPQFFSPPPSEQLPLSSGADAQTMHMNDLLDTSRFTHENVYEHF